MEAGRELDTWVAEEVMDLVRGVDFGRTPRHQWRLLQVDEAKPYGDTHVCIRCGLGSGHVGTSEALQLPGPCDIPPRPYSTDIAAVRLVEDEIERRGLGWEYAQELLRLVAYPDGSNAYDRAPKRGSFFLESQPTDRDLWPLLRATPRQKCLAAIKTVVAS